ncbi:MAG: hypothetical protein VX200_03645, partial [Pseudomonadota bacterium]|nr:hypothetical protein [Pseudomonadota bacterium]
MAECLLRRFGITCARMCHAADFMKSSQTWKPRDQTFRFGNDVSKTPLFHPTHQIRDNCLIELHGTVTETDRVKHTLKDS